MRSMDSMGSSDIGLAEASVPNPAGARLAAELALQEAVHRRGGITRAADAGTTGSAHRSLQFDDHPNAAVIGRLADERLQTRGRNGGVGTAGHQYRRGSQGPSQGDCRLTNTFSSKTHAFPLDLGSSNACE